MFTMSSNEEKNGRHDKALNQKGKLRIKRESFIHKNNNLKRIYNNNSIKTVQCTYFSPPMSSEHTNRSLTIRTTIPTVTRDQEDLSKKLLTLSHIDVWLTLHHHIYTVVLFHSSIISFHTPEF